MGCWNETCMLTHLPILEGEPCVGFLVNATGVLGHTSYADKRYRPMSPPVFGTYDSYGRLIKVKDHEKLLSVLAEPDACLSIESDTGTVHSFNALLELVNDGKVQYKSPWQTAGEVSLVLIKTRFYKFALEQFKDIVAQEQRLQAQLFPQPFDAFEAVRIGVKYMREIEVWQSLMSHAVLPHPLITQFARCGFDMSGVAAVNELLEVCRMFWGPTSGAGNGENVAPIMVDFLIEALDAAQTQLNTEDD